LSDTPITSLAPRIGHSVPAELVVSRSNASMNDPIYLDYNATTPIDPAVLDALLAAIRDRVACSTGSACHVGHAEPSAVLLAMGRDPGLAAAALRLSLGWGTTEQDVRTAAAVIGDALQRELR
jgi:cysteine sulfinate desulfinase/cysteine desulfurase-like protein